MVLRCSCNLYTPGNVAESGLVWASCAIRNSLKHPLDWLPAAPSDSRRKSRSEAVQHRIMDVVTHRKPFWIPCALSSPSVW